jgi:hypothetical protein
LEATKQLAYRWVNASGALARDITVIGICGFQQQNRMAG